MDEEAAMYWQDVLDQIVAGREAGLLCPLCDRGRLVVERQEDRVRVDCRGCGRFIEARLASIS